MKHRVWSVLHGYTEISAPAEDKGAGELPEAKLWTDEMAAASAQTPEDAEIAAPLDEAWDKATIESWYETEKEKAKSADHILGENGDIFNSYLTPILPGETIAVVPENFGISDSGMVKYGLLTFNFEIYQLSNPVVETEYNGKNLLPRTGAPSRTTLTEVETSTFHVPYKAREGIEQIDEGSIFSYSYVSLYRNDTGLPIMMSKSDKFTNRETVGKMNGRGGNSGGLSFQGSGAVNYGPTFYFVENYYDVGLDLDTFRRYYGGKGKDAGDLVCSDGKTSWLNTQSPFTFKLYIDGENHTYEIPNPFMKGFSFYGWNDDYQYETSWRWSNLPNKSNPLQESAERNFRYQMTNEKTVLRLNTRDYIVEEGKQNTSLSLFRDILLYPSFEVQSSPVPEDDETQPSTSSIAKAVVTVKDQTYSGKTLKPAVTVKLDGEKLKNGTDYTVTYSKNKNIGTATVTVKGQGKYTGTANGTFRINPKGTGLKKLKKGKKSITVK